MDYNFIKESFKSTVDGNRVNVSDLEKFVAFKENSFILNHNIVALSEFLKFLNDPQENIFILNGFMGSGKTYVADCFIDFVDENVLVFRNSYQESINLDDVLLNLFRDFSYYHNEKKIVLPKVESSIFSDKINAYIKYCNVPMFFIFDSFEINMRSKDSQKDILDFINYLSHFEKVKIVICSRTFKEMDLIEHYGVSSYSLHSLSPQELYEYLENNSIQASKYEMDDLYKVTRGHYLLLELSVLIMNITNQTLQLFLSEFKKSAKNFLEYLISRLLSISSDKFMKIMVLLATVRHGLNIDYIIEQGIATQDDINYLLQKRIIAEKFGQYYLKDYVKSEFLKTLNAETKIKVHEFLVQLYEDELPLKPFERNLFLSRQTMRQEIAYHEKRISSLNEEVEKTGKSKLGDMQDFNYLSYSRTSGYEKGMEPSKPKKYVKNLQTKPVDKRKRFELSKEDSLLLNSSNGADAVSKEMKELVDISEMDYAISKVEDDNSVDISKSTISVPQSLDEYIELAQSYESAFNFTNAIMYYKKALTYKLDPLFDVKEPLIYTKLAICYKKIQDTDEAVRMYEKVYQLYLKESVDKANTVLLSIAQIYNEIYKFDRAKEIYNRILYSPHGVSNEMVVRVYLDLSELEDNNLDIEMALKNAQKALAEAEKLSNIKLLTECYFKYALLLDDSGKLDMALKYYLRCVQCSTNPDENLYLASAYSNLAGLSLDSKNISAAKMYYELSVDIDKKLNNFEGLYYSYSKLAELYKDSPEKRYETLVKALSAAKRFDDISYAISVYIEIGDYYYDIEDYKRSLKSLILAQTLVPHLSNEELLSKINMGIGRLKLLLGEAEFNRLMTEIKKKR